MSTDFDTTQDALSLVRYASAGKTMSVQLTMPYVTGRALEGKGYVTIPLHDVRKLIHDLQAMVDATDRDYPGYTGKVSLWQRAVKSAKKLIGSNPYPIEKI